MPDGSSVYRFGPFELDAPRGRLFRGATRVPLSDPQVAILLQLVSRSRGCGSRSADSLARTVADCFRFRNKVGLDVALEALTEAWRSKRLKLDELNRIAKKLRVQRVMQPYLETVVM